MTKEEAEALLKAEGVDVRALDALHRMPTAAVDAELEAMGVDVRELEARADAMIAEMKRRRTLWAIRSVDGAWLSLVVGRELWWGGHPMLAHWWKEKPTVELREGEEWAVRIDQDGVRGAAVTTGQALAEIARVLGVWP